MELSKSPPNKPPQPQRQKSATIDSNSCRECRRRKAKCDFQLPVCSLCQKYNRHCLYDKHSRTPLTRKHLTNVETRLERAENLLRHLLSDAQVVSILDQKASTIDLGDISNTSKSNPSEPSPGSIYLGSLPVSAAELDPKYSFESTPSAGDDFEWDEQENTGWENDSQDEVSKILDGMGALNVGESSGGYLGTTSGAALLRHIWMSGEGSHDRQSLGKLVSRDSSNTSWLRTEPLITPVMVGMFIDAYFTLYHPTFPILHEATFRAQYNNLIPRPGGGTWHVLANIVVALGSFVSSTDDTDTTIFRTVKRYLSIGSLESGNMTMVQAFGLAANYLQKRNKPNSGYNYGGLALRLAIGLGLHKEFHNWQISPLKLEMRRRVWWSLCVLDVGATVSYGRPLNWPQAGVDTKLPLNIHEKDLITDSDGVRPEVNEATIYTYIRTQSNFHLRTMPIYHRLITNPFPSAEELSSMDDDIIGGWVSSLPSFYRDDESLQISHEFVLPHAIGKWRYRNIRIIMYRPFLTSWAGQEPQTAAEKLATERCFTAAKDTIASISRFANTSIDTRLASFYALYFLFHASLIPVHCLRKLPQHQNSQDWRSQIQDTLNILESMSEKNSSAGKCRDLIYRLCGKYLGNMTFGFDEHGNPIEIPQFGDSQWSPNFNFNMDMNVDPSAFLDECTNLWSEEMWNQSVWPQMVGDPNMNVMI